MYMDDVSTRLCYGYQRGSGGGICILRWRCALLCILLSLANCYSCKLIRARTTLNLHPICENVGCSNEIHTCLCTLSTTVIPATIQFLWNFNNSLITILLTSINNVSFKHHYNIKSVLMTFQLCDTLLPKGTLDSNVPRREKGPIIQQVVYNETSQHLFLRWDQRPNITKYNIQISACDHSLLINTTVNSSCSVSQLSGVNFAEYRFLQVAVQSCVTNDVCGLRPDLRENNIVALNFSNTGKELLGNNYD